MTFLNQILADLSQWWTIHGATVILWALVGTAALIVASLLWARRKKMLPRWLSVVSNALVLGLSAEGMWEFLYDLLELPAPIAIAFCAVGEFMLVNAMIHARSHYHRTTVWEADGDERRVTKWGTTGRHGRTVWIIATVMGVIVATGADRWEEIPFRLALPLGAALMWHTELTAAGVGEAERSSWRWTPRRLLIRLGAIEPGDRDVAQVQADHLLDGLTRALYRRNTISIGWLQRYHARRAAKLALDATDEQISEVAARLRRVAQVEDRTSTETLDLLAETHAEHVAELDRVQMVADEHAAELSAEMERLRELHHADQVVAERARNELTEVLEETRARADMFEAQAAHLTKQVEELRPMAKAVGRLQAERDTARADREAALAQAAEVVKRATVPSRPSSGRELAGPRASVEGTSARKLDAAPTTAESLPVKERVYLLLDLALAQEGMGVLGWSSRALAEYVTNQAGGPVGDPATVVRYARDWVRAVESGEREMPSTSRLRLVGDRSS